MGYISIDLDALEKAKSDVDAYKERRKSLVTQMNNVVEATGSGWNAADNKAFINQWNGMKAADGIFTVTEKNIENYSKILEGALNTYKKAQSESVEQASKL